MKTMRLAVVAFRVHIFLITFWLILVRFYSIFYDIFAFFTEKKNDFKHSLGL